MDIEINIENKMFDIDTEIDDRSFDICKIEITYSTNNTVPIYLVDEIGNVLTDELGNKIVI